MTKILLSNFGWLSRPYRLFLVVTKKCASRCRHCNIWKEPVEEEMTLSEYEKLARQSPFLSWLTISGGEPADREDVKEVIQIFQKHCRRLLVINLTTNGLNPKKIETLAIEMVRMKIPWVVICVSIDGPPAVNDSLRGIKGNFDLAIDTFLRLRKVKGITAKVSFTLYKKNSHLIEATYQAIRARVSNFEKSELHINLPHQSSHFYANDNLKLDNSHIDLESLRQYEQSWRPKIFDILSWVEKSYRQQAIFHAQKKNHAKIKCQAMKASLYVSEKGELYPCTIWNEQVSHLRTEELDWQSLRRSDRFKKLEKDITELNCPNCWTPCEAVPSLLGSVAQLALTVLRWRPKSSVSPGLQSHCRREPFKL